MMTSDQFFGLEKDNPHDHIRWGSPLVARKRTSRPILTWEDLVSKFINELFPPQEQQISVMKSPIFNNDQDSLNSAAGGNLLERRTQDVLTIIENKSKRLKNGELGLVIGPLLLEIPVAANEFRKVNVDTDCQLGIFYGYKGVHDILQGSQYRPWNPDEPRINKIVFIGKNLDAEELEKGFKTCFVRSSNVKWQLTKFAAMAD
nr:hypothetical protein [Tanacetum cinerariifolium]